MRLLDRYLFRELLTPMAYCLGGFIVFWITFGLFTRLDELQAAKLHLLDVIELCAAWTPECLVTVLPVALLLALLYTLTSHARHNEITAMRAAGVSLWRICAPYFTVGLAASAVLFVLNELAVPASSDWTDKIMLRYTARPAGKPAEHPFGFTNERADRKWLFDEFHFKTAEMTGVQVNWNLPDGSKCQLNAKSAVHTNGVWTFYGVSESVRQTPQSVPEVLPMPGFTETPQDIQRDVEFSRYEGLHSLKLDVPLSVLWGYLEAHPDLAPAKANEWWTKLHGRLAAPWTCLVVVLIAIPFGAASGRRNLFFGVAGSLFICFTFFVIQKTGIALGAGGYLMPWLAAWLPNLFFAAIGMVLMARVR